MKLWKAFGISCVVVLTIFSLAFGIAAVMSWNPYIGVVILISAIIAAATWVLYKE